MVEAADERFLENILRDIAGADPALQKRQEPGMIIREYLENLRGIRLGLLRLRHGWAVLHHAVGYEPRRRRSRASGGLVSPVIFTDSRTGRSPRRRDIRHHRGSRRCTPVAGKSCSFHVLLVVLVSIQLYNRFHTC